MRNSLKLIKRHDISGANITRDGYNCNGEMFYCVAKLAMLMLGPFVVIRNRNKSIPHMQDLREKDQGVWICQCLEGIF